MVEIVVFERGWVTLSTNFKGMGRRPPTLVGVRKLKSLGYHVALFAGLAILVEHPTCVRQSDRQTHDDGKYRGSIAAFG